MSKFNSDKVMPRYFAIAVAFTLIGVAIIGKAGYIMTAEKQYWSEVVARLVRDSLSVKPTRGNILSCDGQLMASSIPEFRIFMDFRPGGQRIDTMWTDSVDLICEGLNRIFPAKSAKEFKRDLTKGFEKGARHWPVWKQRIDYGTYTEVKKLPVFRLDKNKGGFHTEEFNSRRRPFGSLASRTVGDMFGAKDTARCGLELSYDSILRGTNGITHRRKVLKNYMSVPVTPPVNGADIITTIDVTMQDIAERSLIDELRKVNGDMGVAILMEVQTGDVKAMVNMTRCADGEYREIMNNAISYRCEPGSVFKPASIMVALDDGVVDTSYVIHTGSGVMDMHGRFMKDHNWRRGGYQDINVARALEVSSNIGVSYVIDRFYYDHPEKYVEGLYRTGIADDLHIPLVGYAKPIIRMPKKNKRGQWLNWSKTALPWMSIGYETQVAPINTVAFYNAIANDGKMMRPRFVKKVVKNGETIMEFPPVVQKERICKPQTVRTLQTVLEHVVSQGLGKKAGSRLFRVAGKTGTAQVSKGAAGYHSGTVDYWLSFAGYFPADEPRYSCIVCIRKSGLPASGGGMSGLVFHHIAEGVMARHIKLSIDDARDPSAAMVPEVKSGNVVAADYVLRDLGVASNRDWGGTGSAGTPVWGRATTGPKAVDLARVNTPKGTVPDVRGMGASDAVYLLESQGLRVRLHGRGRVKRQSCEPGTTLRRGRECVLYLE